MTLTSHANRKVSPTVTPPHFYSYLSPSSPVSHHEHAVLPSLTDHLWYSFYHCVQSPCSLAQHCYLSHPIPFVLGQSDPIVDEHHRQFPHHRFPYHHVPTNHQMKYHFDCHLHPKPFEKPAQQYKFVDSGRCLGFSKIATPYLLTIDSQPVISDEKGVFPITCGHLHVIFILVTSTDYYSASLCIHCLE